MYYLTKGINGDALKERINCVIGPWRGGRFMCLTLRPQSTNLHAFSKLLYRCNSDFKHFNTTAKIFIYADLLLKPNELTLFRDISQGGLGLTCMRARAKAALISAFLETAINPKFIRNHYHNQLYRCRILNKRAPEKPEWLLWPGNSFISRQLITGPALVMDSVTTLRVLIP